MSLNCLKRIVLLASVSILLLSAISWSYFLIPIASQGFKAIIIDGDLSDWNGINPVYVDALNDTWPWSTNVTILSIGNTPETPLQVPINNRARDLKALYVYPDMHDIYFRLDVAGLYENCWYPHGNASLYHIYFDTDQMPGSGQGEAGDAGDVDFSDVGAEWERFLSFDGTHSIIRNEYWEMVDDSATGSITFAINLTLGSMEFMVPRADFPHNLGIVGVTVLSFKPGEAWGNWGNWVHTFDPQAPGTPGETWGNPGLPAKGSDAADCLPGSLIAIAPPGPEDWDRSGHLTSEGVLNVDMSTAPTTVYVDPPLIAVNLGEEFFVEVKILNVVDLYTWAFRLSWTPGLLECSDVAPPCPPWPEPPIWFPIIDNENGYVSVGDTLPTLTGMSGNFTLAKIWFNATAYGSTDLHLSFSALNSEGQNIPRYVFDGFVKVKPPPLPPVADFTYLPTSPYVNGTVTFNASSSTAGGYDDFIASYEWSFGDGSPKVKETDPITTHKFASDGIYTVTLNVTDNEGLWSIGSKLIMISTPPPSHGPTAIFTYSPLFAHPNETVIFNASGSLLGSNGTHVMPIVCYEWDFGDGTPKVMQASPVITHNYTVVCNYTIILNVTDSQGFWNTASKTIKTYPPIHDVAVSDVVPFATEAYPTWVLVLPGRYLMGYLGISVTLENEGGYSETFSVTVYSSGTAIGTETISDLAPGETITLTFAFKLSLPSYPFDRKAAWPYPVYIISANASVVQGETDTADNLHSGGIVKVKWPGDVNGDGRIWVEDLFLFGKAWGSKIGDARWNPLVDFDGDGQIWVNDLYIFGKNWGRGPLD